MHLVKISHDLRAKENEGQDEFPIPEVKLLCTCYNILRHMDQLKIYSQARNTLVSHRYILIVTFATGNQSDSKTELIKIQPIIRKYSQNYRLI